MIHRRIHTCLTELVGFGRAARTRLFKGTVKWQLRWVKIGINQSNMTNCLAGKCSLPCPNGHHHERSINFSASLVHFNTIPTGWVSKHYSVGLILSQRLRSDAVAAQR